MNASIAKSGSSNTSVTLVIAAALLADNMLGAYFLEYDYYYVMLLPHIAISIASLFAMVRLSARYGLAG